MSNINSVEYNPNIEMFMVSLKNAINNEKKSNFADKLYGYPKTVTIVGNIMTISVEPTMVPPNNFGYSMGKVNQVMIDLKAYNEIAPSNSVFSQETQMFYFTNSATRDYFVIIFGC